MNWHIWLVADNEVNAVVKKRDHAIGVPSDLCVCNGHKGHVTCVIVESIFMDQEPVGSGSKMVKHCRDAMIFKDSMHEQ